MHRNRLKLEMEVYSSDEGFLGKVKELRDENFVLDRPMRNDIAVPYSAIQQVDVAVKLSVSMALIDQMGWPFTSISFWRSSPADGSSGGEGPSGPQGPLGEGGTAGQEGPAGEEEDDA